MAIETVLRQRSIRQLGLPPVATVDLRSSLHEALKAMRAVKAGSVLVTENQCLVGIFTERDLISKGIGSEVNESLPIRDFMTARPTTLGPNDSVFDAVQLVDEYGYRNIPLVDEQGRLVGNLPVSALIDFLAESFPQEVLALPPRANQQFPEADGA